MNNNNKRLILSTLLIIILSILAKRYFSTITTTTTIMTSTTKTIGIVGSGLAGLSAAIEAYDQANNDKTLATPPKIILFEKEKNIGGNSMKASSGINAVEPKHNDSMDQFYQDTLQAGHGQPALVEKLVQESPSALAWLTAAGVDLSVVSQCGGHSCARTHRCPPGPNGMPVPVGFKLVDTLKKRAQQLGIEMQTSSRVTSIQQQQQQPLAGSWTLTINDNDETHINVDALVLTSGGFGGQIHATDKNTNNMTTTLLKEYAPQWVDRATTNGPWANGDGVRLGMAVGAAIIDMDQVQIHPTGFVDPLDPDAMTKFLAPEALRAYGGLLLDAQGRRFVNELTTRDKLTEAILATSSKVVYLVLSDQAAKAFGESTLGFYAKKGLVQKLEEDGGDGSLLKQLAGAMGLEQQQEEVLATTFKDYDAYTEGQQDPFGKSRFPSPMLTSPCYWLARITPCVHYTMGGLKINTEAQILSQENDTPIPGLFGAGEVTGGVHGSNRLAGNSLLECVVYGRTAGRHAYKYLVN